MKRIETITAKALELVGHDRYKLVLMVSKRAEQLSNGAELLSKQIKTNKNIQTLHSWKLLRAKLD